MPEVSGKGLKPTQEPVQPTPGGHAQGEAAANRQGVGSTEGRGE